MLRALRGLPPEKQDEIRDFAYFLRDKYGQVEAIDESNEWSEEDLREFAAASFDYADISEASR